VGSDPGDRPRTHRL